MEPAMMLSAYESMVRIRRAEERLVNEYREKNIRSFVHFYVGQEAVAVGVCKNLSENDYVFGNHRSHGHYLAKGGDLGRLVAELYGKATGCAKGRGGSMHLVDRSVGFMGSISILGSVVPVAVGAAFSAKQQGEDRRCVVFIGDGATEEGVVYESINFASLYKLPMVFVVENNLYAVMSPKSARRSQSFDLAKVAEGLGATYYQADGNDFFHVYETTQRALARMAEDEKPCVVECIVFRHMSHSGPVFDDDAGYRKIDDVESRAKQCSIRNLKRRILEERPSEAQFLDDLDRRIDAEVEAAIRFAEESSYPDPSELLKGVYSE